MPGVYLLSDPNTGFLKIGRATDLEERLASLRTGNPDLTLEAWFETDQASKLESNLHGVFGFKRRRGEFFEVALHEAKAKAEDILGWIQSMPLEQELSDLGNITELNEVRDPNDTELALMWRLVEIKSQKLKSPQLTLSLQCYGLFNCEYIRLLRCAHAILYVL